MKAIALPPALDPATAPGTGVYFRHYGDYAGTVETIDTTIARVLPPGIPPGEGFPTIDYPLDQLTITPIAADPTGTPAERALYSRLEDATGQRLRRDLEALHPHLYTAPSLPSPRNTVTSRIGRLQAGTVRAGDLTVYYSYATAIGGQVAGQSPIFTDAYYSVRTEEHAITFGRNATQAIVLPDPDFRRALAEVCRKRGHAVPLADFGSNRETAFPNSPFFGQRPERGQNPKVGSYVYVLRDIAHRPDADLCHGYRVKAIYCGIVKADDPARGWKKGQRQIRPAHLGYGVATEAVDAALCQTEGGGHSFPRAS